ncbi:MAG: ABC transporter permease [Parcubacteria group bacterium]|nr:ABC transporter permease [Parcubacteria group bacterium]
MAENHLRFIDLLKLSFRTFRIKPLRTFLTILGMSIGIGAVLFLVSLGYGLQFILIGRLVTTEDSLITLEVSYPSEIELFIKNSEIENLKKISEIDEISPIAEFSGEIKSGDVSGLIFTTIVKSSYFRVSGVTPDIGANFKEDEAGAIISAQTAELLNFPINETFLGKELNFDIFYQDEKGNLLEPGRTKTPLFLKGIITDETLPPIAIIPTNFIDKEPPFFRKLLIKAKNMDVLEKLRDILFEKGFLISSRIDLVTQAKKILNIITIVLGIFGVTALIVSAIGMFNTMIVGFLERIYEVGIIKSLGATDKDVRNLFLMESSMMGFLGGVGGVILGVGGGKIINFGLSVLISRLGGKPFDLFITPIWFIAFIIIISIFIGLVAGFWPARRAAYLSPKEAFVRK